jgi:uncharacterized phage protein gp47/JayE
MPRFVLKRYEQILSGMIAKLIARTELNDLLDSSTFKHLLSAAAMSDDEQYYQISLILLLNDIDNVEGDDLDEFAKILSNMTSDGETLARRLSSRSVGTVIFSRNIVSGSITKESGIIVKTNSGITFRTTSGFTINVSDPAVITGHTTGQDSSPIPIQSLLLGENNNVAANTIIKFANKPIGIDAVINLSDTTFGRDKEKDDQYRKRIKGYINSLVRSTPFAMENAILGLQDPVTGSIILFAKLIEDIVNLGNCTLYIDDGTGYAQSTEEIIGENITYGLAGPPVNSAVGGETYLFLDSISINEDASFIITSSTRGVLVKDTDFYYDSSRGQINFTPALVAGEIITADYTKYTGIIELAQKVINGVDSDRSNYPGYRGGGVRVKVRSPQVLIVNIEGSIVIQEGYNTEIVYSNVEDAILRYINTLNISGDVIIAALVAVIKNVDGVYDVAITSPSNNISILDDQLARTSINNVSIR